MRPALQLRPARQADWQAVSGLLVETGLPLAGARENLDNFVIACRGDAVIGCAGMEIYGAAALLRSVAVAPRYQGTGAGSLLVSAVIDAARQREIFALYLLTLTAGDYFRRRGFEPALREDVPAALNGSAEFRGACPASAILLRLALPRAAISDA